MKINRGLKQVLKNILPRPLYLKVRRNITYGAQDLFDFALDRRPDLVPPKRMIYIGGPEFVKIGDEFFGYFRNLGGISSDHAILDIGSGIGRMARPFTNFLSGKGSFHGFDIDPIGTRWCEKNITPRYPNFKFEYVDIHNKHYNSTGKVNASEFKFPYPDSCFDFALATSVFTHMFPPDVGNYIRESSRVLKSGAKCLFTYFLLNPESRSLIDRNRSAVDFRYEMDGILTSDKSVPEDAICLREELVKSLYEKYGFRIISPIRYGSWSGRSEYLSFQDIILAEKL